MSKHQNNDSIINVRAFYSRNFILGERNRLFARTTVFKTNKVG